jgi:L-lactate dehydrogenase complex protein LldE
VRVALFVTCLADALYPAVGRATVTVLERLGHEVVFPEAQTCCGQMHSNTGYRRGAARLGRHHARVFEGYEAVVAPSGSCVAHVRHADPSAPTYELSEFLVDVLGVTDVGARFPYRVTYHPTCHSLRLLRVGDRPPRLLRAVRELHHVELPDADQCCGFGGTFALKNADTSAAMLADKLDRVAETGADAVCAGDSSCLMHIGGGLSRLAVGTRPVHLAEILAAT